MWLMPCSSGAPSPRARVGARNVGPRERRGDRAMLGLASPGRELLLSRAMGNFGSQVIRLRVQVRYPEVKRLLLSGACSMACSPVPLLAVRAGSYRSGSLVPPPPPPPYRLKLEEAWVLNPYSAALLPVGLPVHCSRFFPSCSSHMSLTQFIMALPTPLLSTFDWKASPGPAKPLHPN